MVGQGEEQARLDSGLPPSPSLPLAVGPEASSCSCLSFPSATREVSDLKHQTLKYLVPSPPGH